MVITTLLARNTQQRRRPTMISKVLLRHALCTHLLDHNICRLTQEILPSLPRLLCVLCFSYWRRSFPWHESQALHRGLLFRLDARIVGRLQIRTARASPRLLVIREQAPSLAIIIRCHVQDSGLIVGARWRQELLVGRVQFTASRLRRRVRLLLWLIEHQKQVLVHVRSLTRLRQVV